MKYLMDISQVQAKKIQKLIKNEQYESVAQFVSVAIENQLYLEESETKPINSPQITDVLGNLEKEEKLTIFEKIKLKKIQSEPQIVSEPTFKQLVLSNSEKKEENTWIWGQINRILPIKIGIRILLRELDNNKWIELDHFLEKATDEAARIGEMIRSYENSNDKKRDEKISAGLPNLAKEKSKTRYKSHFLTYSRKDGLLNGAIAILRFANIQKSKRNGNYLIGLTKSGLQFANINNPVLDVENFDKSLSKEETDFYLNHTERLVVNEYEAIKWILKKIDEGINERNALNEELKKDYGEIWDASEAVINTQRAGLMARMFELGLLDKEKKGIYVTYKLSNFGKSYLIKN